MREATNLDWADTPFGAARRPFAERTPLLAAFSVVHTDRFSPAAAGAVYLRLPRGRLLMVADTTLRFGFHAVAAQDAADVPAIVALVDGLLVQARRQAAVLAGHRFAGELSLLTAAIGRPVRGITSVAAAWGEENPERGLARLLDTADRTGPATLADLCARHRLHGLDRSPGGHAAEAASSLAVLDPLRQSVGHALAIALIAARNTGHYQWDDLHLDALVDAAAWDQTTSVRTETA
ncbi:MULTISPECIES: hypothetical protein [Frankia]|uniref:hypothetical protein n=2 Tax=Frankiaceae TaxID=74712 RepID=UPI0021BEBB97|nr:MULTISPECIES: hypothetical protein [Frankia]